jgi:hypothetical protein
MIFSFCYQLPSAAKRMLVLIFGTCDEFLAGESLIEYVPYTYVRTCLHLQTRTCVNCKKKDVSSRPFNGELMALYSFVRSCYSEYFCFFSCVLTCVSSFDNHPHCLSCFKVCHLFFLYIL